MIKYNIEQIRQEIALAAAKSPYNQGEVKLLAVTKTVEPMRIKEAVEAGLDCLGENRVQELLSKYDELNGVKWHIIGHLQTNKVKYIVDKISMLESLDSMPLALEIEKEAAKHGIILPVLVQVNIDNDEGKFGIAAEACRDFLYELQKLPHLSVEGLMTIGCLYEDKTLARSTFRNMRRLYDELLPDFPQLKYLSMGMSHDYAIAVEEGANIVRIGSAIFGARQ